MINNVFHINRGYDSFLEKLRSLNASERNLKLEGKYLGGQNIKRKVSAFIIRETANGKYQVLVHKCLNDAIQFFRVPGGGVDQQEEATAAARREIKEEAGLENVKYISSLGSTIYYKEFIQSYIQRYDLLFLVDGHTPDNWEHCVTGNGDDKGEIYSYEWIDIQQLHVLDPELTTHIDVIKSQYA